MAVSDSSAALVTAAIAPNPRERITGWGNTSIPANAHTSSSPENITVRPAVSTVRRRPHRSSPTPISNWATPNDRPNSPAKAPSDPGDRPNSAVSPWARMAVVVRNAWLSANPLSSVSSMAHSTRLGGRPLSAVGVGAGAGAAAGVDLGIGGGAEGLLLTAARRTPLPSPARWRRCPSAARWQAACAPSARRRSRLRWRPPSSSAPAATARCRPLRRWPPRSR